MKKASNKVIKKAKKELNALAKCKKDDLDDDQSEASINNVEILEQQMKDVDKCLQEFDLRRTEIDVWRLGRGKITLAESNKSSSNDENELFVSPRQNNHGSLDQCIGDAQLQSKDLFSFVDLVQGQPPCKKTKFKDLKPIVFVRPNSRLGKVKKQSQLH